MSSLSKSSTSPSSYSATYNTAGDLSNDVALNDPPEDTVSCLSCSPAADYLAVSSWDNKVRIYQFNEKGQSVGKHMYEHDAPPLSVDWSKDGTKLVSAGTDRMAKMCDVQTGQLQQVAAHDKAIRSAKFLEAPGGNGTMLVTGSWDRTIKYWDLRQSTPAATIQAQERIYSMDVRKNSLVVATADRYINVVKFTEPTKFYTTIQSQLSWQTRVVRWFNDASGFVVGSIEGRSAIHHVEEKDTANNFTFKCHRDPPQGIVTNAYAVNDISFHPEHGTFSTAGSDGTYHFWDKDCRHRLKGFPKVGGHIVATAFNNTGSVFIYAIGYDWSKGYQANSPTYPNKIMLHPVQDDDLKPRPNAKKKR